jgi:SulP family sulfate permease
MNKVSVPPEPEAAETSNDSHGTDIFPGFTEIKSAVKTFNTKTGRHTIAKDLTAGLSVALNEVPDGMASGLLSGVSPIMGLYGTVFGPVVGGLLNSSKLMVVTTTSAAAFVCGQFLSGYPAEQKPKVLMLLIVLAGGLMILFGLLKLGNLVRFVSFSVMTGFLYGIAVLTILSQLPTLFGISASGKNKILQTVDLFSKIAATNWQALLTGMTTLLIILSLSKTKIGKLAAILGVAIPSIAVLLLKWRGVEVVEDISTIPRGLPQFSLPDFSLISSSLFAGAFSLTAVILIQAAGVSQAVPNPDGKRLNLSKDFIGQGAANIVSGVFGGIAVGGSLSSTSLNILSGARTKWAAVFIGLSVLTLVVIAPGLVAKIAMPVLAMIMIYASAGSIKLKELKQIWHLSHSTRLLILSTFIITLVMPVQYAVLIGIVLSAILYFYTSSKEVKVVALQPRTDGKLAEIPAPEKLESRSITLLQISGAIHFAGARTAEKQLPKITKEVQQPLVILRLKHRDMMGATFVEVLDNYAELLTSAGGILYLTGLGKEAYDSIERMQAIHVLEKVKIYPETEVLGEGTWQAYHDAQQDMETIKEKA